MFGLASGLYQSYFSTPQLNVLLLGAEGVGKTTMLERLKVTQFSNRVPVAAAAAAASSTAPKQQRTFSCPAPLPRYANAKVNDDDDDDEEYDDDDDDDEDEEYKDNNHHHDSMHPETATTTTTDKASTQKKWLQDKQQSSLEDVPGFAAEESNHHQQQQHNTVNLIQNEESTIHESSREKQRLQQQRQPLPELNHENGKDNEEEPQDFNLKPGHKMLPLNKIRPTSGQNLAKLDCCGAKCHIFDISGKFRNLWERYYGDADAVIFCWRLDYSEADQRTILETVRREIPDDVPILIFGHEFNGTTTVSSTTRTMNDSSQELQQQQQRMPMGKLQRHVQKQQQRRPISKMTSTTTTTTAKTIRSNTTGSAIMTPLATELFLPNYHSNLMYAICGSAKTGKGIREAMEWLIPLAKRQAKMRSQEAAAAAAAVANHGSR